MAGLPGVGVGVDEGLDVVAKSLTGVEDGAEICLAGPGCDALVGSAGDLVEVTTDGVEFGDAAPESCEFTLWERGEISEVGSDEERNVGGGGHAPGSGALADQESILRSQSDVEPAVSRIQL
jgi:hypothetical protein